MSSTSISTVTTVHSEVFELFSESSENSSINEVASLQNVFSASQLQQQLSPVLKNHQTMDDTFNQMGQVHIANLIKFLDYNKKRLYHVHLATNASRVLGLVIALVIAFISFFASTVESLILVGLCVAIAAAIIDLLLQKTIMSKLSDMTKFFEIKYEIAKHTYTASLDSFNEYCDVLSEYYPECTSLRKESDIIVQPKLTHTSMHSLKLVLQSGFTVLSYSKDFINFILSILNRNSNIIVWLKMITVSVFQIAEPFVSNVTTIAPITRIIIIIYILLDTVKNFFDSGAASKDIDLYMVKLYNFQKDLLHVSDQAKLDIQVLKSKVARIVENQEIALLQQQLESQKIDFAKETLAQKQSFDNSLKSKEEHFVQQMELLKRELQNDLTMQQQFYERLMNHQQKSLQDQLNIQNTIINDQKELISKMVAKLANC